MGTDGYALADMANGVLTYVPTADERHRAQMVVCSFARSVEEARGFFEMLDIG